VCIRIFLLARTCQRLEKTIPKPMLSLLSAITSHIYMALWALSPFPLFVDFFLKISFLNCEIAKITQHFNRHALSSSRATRVQHPRGLHRGAVLQCPICNKSHNNQRASHFNDCKCH
jgi:hypothetical protein